MTLSMATAFATSHGGRCPTFVLAGSNDIAQQKGKRNRQTSNIQPLVFLKFNISNYVVEAHAQKTPVVSCTARVAFVFGLGYDKRATCHRTGNNHMLYIVRVS